MRTRPLRPRALQALEQAKGEANLASQIISSAKAEISYAVAKKQTPDVEFLK